MYRVKFHCTVGLQFNLIGFDLTRKYVAICLSETTESKSVKVETGHTSPYCECPSDVLGRSPLNAINICWRSYSPARSLLHLTTEFQECLQWWGGRPPRRRRVTKFIKLGNLNLVTWATHEFLECLSSVQLKHSVPMHFVGTLLRSPIVQHTYRDHLLNKE